MKRFLFVSFAVCLSACGGGSSSSPTAPTPAAPAAPTVTSVTISGLDAIRSGFFSSYTATANMSNGTTQAATAATWTSDNPTVASVASNGDVDGNSNGTATISATFNGVRGSKTVRIVANFGGNWTGTYRMMKCDEAGNFRGWCAGLGGPGTILPLSLSLTQSGNGRDQISGTMSLGTLGGNITGNVTGDGRLILGGTFSVVSGSLTAIFKIGGWDTRLSATGMSGSWAHTLQSTGLTGNAYQENTIINMSHLTNGNSVPQRDTVLFVAPVANEYHMTLGDAAARMRQR